MPLADFIEANTEAIIREWDSFARARSTAAAGMSTLVLHDHVDEILAAVARDMQTPQSPGEQAEKGKGRGDAGPLDVAGASHASQRGDVGLTLSQVASELRALRASVVRLWEQSSPELSRADLGDLVRFNEAIDQILLESMTVYHERLRRTREQFLATVEHDLRNPLGAIVMSANLMSRRKDLDAESARTAMRAESSQRATPSASLGLGLFIVREIVAAHGGEVLVTSSAAQGTTFTVRLPRRPPPAADPRQSLPG